MVAGIIIGAGWFAVDRIVQEPTTVWTPVPATYGMIVVDCDCITGDCTYDYVERTTMMFVPCTTDTDCYDMCIEAGGTEEWCEEGLMIGG
jgi:hypothetical protein